MQNIQKTIRIIICDDHSLVRSGIAKLLEGEKWIYLVGEAENGEEMIKKYESLRPDLVLADISMPVLSGLEAVKEIKMKYPESKILMLTMLIDEQYIYWAFKVGASGFISKNVSSGELIYAIKEIASGRNYFGPLYDEKKLKEIIKKYDNKMNSVSNTLGKLTLREEEVLKYISQGLMSGEIAEKMSLGKRTVDKLRTNIMQKYNLKSLPALISFAVHYTENKK